MKIIEIRTSEIQMGNLSKSFLNRLTKKWEDIFSQEDFIDFSSKQYPMLIGITRQPSGRDDPFIEPSYKFEVLLSGHDLVRTSELLNLEGLLYQLIIFKKEFDENEENFVSVLSYLNFDYEFHFSHLILFYKLVSIEILFSKSLNICL
jgi:hypothetical protein